MHDSKSTQLGRVEAIDALRGLAALAVLVFHGREILWIGGTETFMRHGFSLNPAVLVGYLTAPFRYGYLGVTLFFVLSGYCIHRRGARHLAASPEAGLDIKQFALRRVWRVYPTYIAALLLTLLVDNLLLTNPAMSSLAAQDRSLSTFLFSLLTLQGYCAPPFGSNYVFWTLAMEMHLYAAYPLLFYISRKWGAKIALLTTLFAGIGFLAADALFGIESRLTHRFLRGPVFLPYWFSWGIGFYLAEVEAGRQRMPQVRLVVMIAAFGAVGGAVLTALKHYVFAEPFLALLFGGLLYWSLSRSGRAAWDGLLGRGVAWCGVFSYSLYASHVLFLNTFKSIFSSDGSKFETILPAIIGMCWAVVLAWVFFQLVERWSIKAPNG